jgi:hypothetical protein
MRENWYWYEQTEEKTLRLLRMFGASPAAAVPETILGRTVTELGNYCFAGTNRAASYRICSDSMEGQTAEEQFFRQRERGRLRELCGDYLKTVTLPKSIKRIGNFCFYQCGALEQMTLGSGLTEIGSDAFMNCRKLQKLTILDSVGQPSGLRQILGQRNLETRVEFVKNQQTEAVLIYPEYSETYDEIGPAHIFTLNIEGEGFRARQCFREGIVDLAQYDAVFLQANAKESVKTLCNMAEMRLYYPAGLSRESKAVYESYIKDHAGQAVEFLTAEKNLELLTFLGEKGYLTQEVLKEGIRLAALSGWTEGAGMLLQCQSKWFAETEREEYSFEEF